MKITDLQYKDITKELVRSLLYEGIAYDNSSADIAIVMGSYTANRYRVPCAIDLYQNRKVKKLIFSGGQMLIASGIRSEADLMKDAAIASGISPNDIYTDFHSSTTKQNIINSYHIVKEHFSFDSLDKIILITTTFHMKRCLLLAQKIFPKSIKIVPCPVDDIRTTESNWNKNPEGYERAIGEVLGIVQYAKNGDIDIFDV